LISVI